MERILIFIDWYIPGYKAGGPVQSVANLVYFLKKHYLVDIITRNTDYTENQPYYNVKSDCWNTLEENVRVFYFDKKSLSRRKIAYLIKPNYYNTVYINGVYSKYFSRFPLAIAKRKKISRIIVAPRGMFSVQSLKIKPLRKKIYLALSKKLKTYDNIILHATNNYEEGILRGHFPHAKIISSPNFPRVNTENFKIISKDKKDLKLLFLGRISPEKNLLFAIRILSKMTDLKIHFDVYGSVYDQHYWQKCKAEAAILPKNILFKYGGSVKSENVFDVIRKYHALFMPTLGENFGHSIYESLVMGRPVIISKNTPWKNLRRNKCGWDLSLKEEESFSACIRELYAFEQDEYNIWCNSSYMYAMEYLVREGIFKKALDLFNYAK